MNDERNRLSEEQFLIRRLLLEISIERVRDMDVSLSKFKAHFCPPAANDAVASVSQYSALHNKDEKCEWGDSRNIRAFNNMVGACAGGWDFYW